MEGMILFIAFICICFSMIQYLFAHHKRTKDRQALEVFLALCIIYCTVIIGFAIIYFICSRKAIVLHSLSYDRLSMLEQLYECVYFSGVTMLTIGYGDISPVGIGRFIALIQALIGYILPTAFVLKLMHIRT